MYLKSLKEEEEHKKYLKKQWTKIPNVLTIINPQTQGIQ
jgi:hypothetical protein